MPTTQTQEKIENWLPSFLAEYEQYRTLRVPTTSVQSQSSIDPGELAQWLDTMREPLVDARRGALHCDPWEIAGLGRDEVRHSAVLAWLLNPRGTHGIGDILLGALLKYLNGYFEGGFPEASGLHCYVRVESCPEGYIDNRVDIEIDGDGVYLIIEVKIDSQESDGQLERYSRLASTLAGNREWAIVFLTPQGDVPKKSPANLSRVVPISWRELSLLMIRALRSHQHVFANDKSAKRQMADQVAQIFLKRIRCL